MKKLLACLAFLAIAFSASAQQIADNAIGIRFGGNNGFGAELSYQRKMSPVNRLEIDLGIRGKSDYSAFKATGLYQWVWPLQEGFQWFAGAGGGLGNWKNKITDNSNTFLFAAGVVGIEYSFDFPLMISLDFRPEFGFSDAYDGFNSDFGLGVRYQF
ncbi:conserved exported hypothetical protein [Tenacibaculum litopenaei]|uniref:hypothetical protein n=1 Tax=Tenacibaculum litopenaei TaxID=396016 RepID=UPI00389571FF